MAGKPRTTRKPKKAETITNPTTSKGTKRKDGLWHGLISLQRRSRITPATPLRTLPARQGRSTDPTGNKARVAQAAAAKAAKAAKAEIVRLRETAIEVSKETLMQMEVDESFVQEQERAHRVRRASGMIGDGESDEGEFAGLREMSFTDSEMEEDVTTSAKERQSQQRKGTSKAGINFKLREEVAAKKPKKTAARSTSTKKQLEAASGFNPAWIAQQKLREVRDLPDRARSQEDQGNAITDAVIESTRPNYPPSPEKFDRDFANAKIQYPIQRNPKRKNNLATAGPLRVVDTKLPAGHKKKAVSQKDSEDEGEVEIVTKTKARTQKGHASQTGSTASIVPDFVMPKGGATIRFLPSIINSSKERYFAALYSALYASISPFDAFTRTSPTFLQISRGAFSTVWPDLDYTLESDDTLHRIGLQRIIEKRGKIYNAVVADLETCLQNLTPTEVVAWTLWFRSTFGGPLFYEKPIPQDGIWMANDPQYKNPSGFLRSLFLIRLGTRFLKDKADSPIDHGPPQGLFILLLTACERAVRAFKTGQYIDPPGAFSADTCNTWIRQYAKNFENRTEFFWRKVLGAYESAPPEEDDYDQSRLDMCRAALPMSDVE